MKKADNFNASKWLVENKITFQSRLNQNQTPGVDVEVDDDMITLSGDSGEYDGFIEDDGTVNFSVTNDEEEFDDQNWKDILGDNHVFVKVANAIPTKVEAMGDYVMITVKADDLTGINESRLNENEDLVAKIAALPNHHTAENTEDAILVVGNYAVVRYDESDEGGENMYVVWDNTINQDEIGSYDDEPEFESTDPSKVAAFLKKNKSLNENEEVKDIKIMATELGIINLKKYEGFKADNYEKTFSSQTTLPTPLFTNSGTGKDFSLKFDFNKNALNMYAEKDNLASFKFKSLKPGEVDDRGWFEIVEVK